LVKWSPIATDFLSVVIVDIFQIYNCYVYPLITGTAKVTPVRSPKRLNRYKEFKYVLTNR